MSEPHQARVLTVEQHMLAAEGAFHVRGVYYADAFDADRQRRWLAERLVREANRYATMDARRPCVATWLAPRERSQVDAAGDGQFRLVHQDALDAVRRDLAAGVADGALISAVVMRPIDISNLAALVRGFPATPIVGLVSETDERHALAGALAFGASGLRLLVDARDPSGWRDLRSAFASNRVCEAGRQSGLMEIVSVLGEAPAGLVRFFVATFDPDASSMRRLADRFGIRPSTLSSRFYRAHLPSPKRYLAFARLVRAAYLLESAGLSVAAVADRLDASSPQSFQRSVRTYMGVTATEFRQRYSGAAMVAYFRSTLITPYVARLRTFDPFAEVVTHRVPLPVPVRIRPARFADVPGRAIPVQGRAD